ncbi:helix-turn-helix domain-containing protein [Stappia taiwanensis]|uniref:Helix-turn-helix domain-containing protein n=1 Tax=Stappia taiwanensis TaxID=992267 RepID=A0A838Y4J0_9HYPH|nr:helix-turn-helix domain-containing protein [Stappia taiwanensis]MBA4613770.1 helix-turn-helix domain-containing protein [Stappia taiwanensis]GGE93509.1 transcriptional regulator [Stappia taiwanensis]
MAYAERMLDTAGGQQAADLPDALVFGLKDGMSTTAHSHAPHSVVFYEGDNATRFYEVDEGIVMLFKLLPDGRRQVVEILNPGTIFGVSAGDLYDCSAETLTRTSLRAFDRREVERSLPLQRHLTRCLLTQMETLHDHAVLLGRKSAIERVSSFLMRLVPQRGGIGCMGPDKESASDSLDVVLTMTRQEIADYLGLTIETVSRVISDLKRRGLVTVERQDRIRINRICGICQLSGIH